ncbi:hypothetical protein [uncultured Oscillibacter sp.]|uniref:hypothetical protein n=1 Tax=uncultured Oscillibacter sp. TaxID=876091 RepID=UPI0025E10E51|nr:hypothetical protein [uncultured Oscillibacter sp.]
MEIARRKSGEDGLRPVVFPTGMGKPGSDLFYKKIQNILQKIVIDTKSDGGRTNWGGEIWIKQKKERKTLPISQKWKMCPPKKCLIFLGEWFIMGVTH